MYLGSKTEGKSPSKTCLEFCQTQYIWKTFHPTLAVVCVAYLIRGFKIRVPKSMLVKYLLVFTRLSWHLQFKKTLFISLNTNANNSTFITSCFTLFLSDLENVLLVTRLFFALCKLVALLIKGRVYSPGFIKDAAASLGGSFWNTWWTPVLSMKSNNDHFRWWSKSFESSTWKRTYPIFLPADTCGEW